MRLERHDDPPIERAGGVQNGCDLRWVMAVVVDNQDAVRFATNLEAPLGATEGAEPRRHLVEGQPELGPDRNRRERVLQVVPARYLKNQRPEGRRRLPRTGGAPRLPFDHGLDTQRSGDDTARRHVGLLVQAVCRHAPGDPRKDCGQIAIVGARDDHAVERHLVGKVDERLLQVVEAAVVFKVLPVDVGDHGNRRKQFQE